MSPLSSHVKVANFLLGNVQNQPFTFQGSQKLDYWVFDAGFLSLDDFLLPSACPMEIREGDLVNGPALQGVVTVIEVRQGRNTKRSSNLYSNRELPIISPVCSPFSYRVTPRSHHEHSKVAIGQWLYVTDYANP